MTGVDRPRGRGRRLARGAGRRGRDRSRSGGYPSGQRGQTVNLVALPSQVRILLHPCDRGWNDRDLEVGVRRLSEPSRPGLGTWSDRHRGCNSMVEYLPSKQATWVRFPSPALGSGRSGRCRATVTEACRLERRDQETEANAEISEAIERTNHCCRGSVGRARPW